MNLDKEIELLQQKIQEQDQTLLKCKAEEQKLIGHIADFQESMKKKTVLNSQTDKQPQIDAEKVTRQLQKEIDNAAIMLKNYQNQLRAMHKRTTKVQTDDLVILEENLKDKQGDIKQIKDQIKELQFLKRKHEKRIEKKAKDEDGGKLTRLVEEVRKNRELLENVKKKCGQKEIILNHKKKTLEELEQKYREKCEKNGEKPLLFEELKDKKKQKERRREDQSVSRPKNKRVQQSVRDIVHGHILIDNYDCSEKSLKELRTKKQIVEASLKNAHKKYEKEIEEMEQKLEQMQKENESLNTRLLQKKKQKQMGQNGYMEGSRSFVSRTMRKLTPLK